MRRKLEIITIAILIALFFIPFNVYAEKKNPARKIGPLLRKEIQKPVEITSEPSVKKRTAERETPEVVKIIVVFNRDHLKPLPQDLIDQLKERVENLGGYIGNHAYNNVQVWLPLEKMEELAEWDEIQSYHWLRASISPYYLLGMALFGADKNDLGEADYESYFAEQGWEINDIISWKPHTEA